MKLFDTSYFKELLFIFQKAKRKINFKYCYSNLFFFLIILSHLLYRLTPNDLRKRINSILYNFKSPYLLFQKLIGMLQVWKLTW